jgi:hypothetical protein
MNIVEVFESGFRAVPVQRLLPIAAIWILCATAAVAPLTSDQALAQEEGVTAPSLQGEPAVSDDTAAPSQGEEAVRDDKAAASQGEGMPTPPSPEVMQTLPEATSPRETPAEQPSEEKDLSLPTDTDVPVGTEPMLSEAEQWAERLEVLLEDMRTLDAETEDADTLYAELSSDLRTRRSELREALTRAGGTFGTFQDGAGEGPDLETIEHLYATLGALYAVRGPEGMNELRAEILQLMLYGRVQALLIPHMASDWPTQLKHAPLPLVERVLVIIIAMIVFRQWRRWAPGFLKRARESLAEARPRRHLKLRAARLIWYFDQVRRPLEWLAFLAVIFKAAEFDELQDLEKALSSVAHWLLLAWFAVALINAIAARGVAGLSGETAGLRLRSLRIIAAWVVLLGLGLDLAETYLGQGTAYEWVWFLFKILALPLLLLLIAMWRSEIFRQLALEPQVPGWMKSALQYRRGLKSFWSAAIGGAYLIVLRLQQQLLRSTSELDWGRRFQATLYQRELTKGTARRNEVGGELIDGALRKSLLEGEGKIFKRVGDKEFARLSKLVEQDNIGMSAVVAERGGGKTVFLQRIATEFMDKVVLFDCPLGGFEAFQATLAEALGMEQSEPTSADFQHRVEEAGIRVIAVDNFHRLSRPVKDGFQDMDRLAEFVRGLELRVLWVLALDSAAWNYIRRTRAARIILLEEIYLPPWTEDQIGNLIDLRCDEVGITPNFGELMLPQQLDAVDLETMIEHNRAGFRRLIWHTAGGNPAIALRLWANSLVVTEDGEFVVRLAEQQATKELEGLSLVGLLVLRVIAQFDLAADEDIVESLRFSRSEVGNAIAVALRKGWIEQTADRYRISWDWYRTITTVLSRRNLLVRRTRGGLI